MDGRSVGNGDHPKRRSVGRSRILALRSHAIGSCLVSIIGNIIIQVNAMLLQKGMYFHSRFEPKHPPKRRLEKEFCAVAFQSQRFKRDPRRFLAFGSNLTSKFVRNVERNLHAERLAWHNLTLRNALERKPETELPSCDGLHHKVVCCKRIHFEVMSVDQEKGVSSGESDSFVAIEERVI